MQKNDYRSAGLCLARAASDIVEEFWRGYRIEFFDSGDLTYIQEVMIPWSTNEKMFSYGWTAGLRLFFLAISSISVLSLLVLG